MVRRSALAFLLALLLLTPLLEAQSAIEPDEIHYTYDAANNLTSRTEEAGGMVTTESFPSDLSGRNRPAFIGDVPLAWDNNGNLIQKGELHFAFDYQNRLVQIRDAGGQILGSNKYDALGRRVRQTIGGDVIETVWKDWQPVETYVNGVLASRRAYGASIDEIVYLEQDLDLDGTMDTRLHPIYDHSGNLALVTGESGKPVERYSYDPYGRRRIYVDATPPAIVQVVATDATILVEFSEMVNASAIEAGITSGKIRLEDEVFSTTFNLSADSLHLHAKRHRLKLIPDPLPTAGTDLTLTFESDTITDAFFNQTENSLQRTFAWPSTDIVIFDGKPPKVVEVAYSESALEIEFSETVDPGTAPPAIQVSGMGTNWTVDPENPYRLLSAVPVPDGTHDLLITDSLKDASGTGLTPPFSFQLHVYPETPYWIAYREPDSREILESAVANAFGFHGLERDPLTGFVYMRNRYFDPEMGRFITADPMGYVDGPSMYAAFGNDPINNRDPLGLDAIAIAFVDYQIAVGDSRLPDLGHAAVITLRKHGAETTRLSTKYFEYGRYDRAKIGLARNQGIPDAQAGANGLPTRESLKRMLKAVSERYGQQSRIKAAYFVTDDESTMKMNAYAWNCVKDSTNPNREPYSILTHNCGTFAEDVVEAGGVEIPLVLDPRPTFRAPLWQAGADFSIEYDPKTDELVVEDTFFTASKEEILKWKTLPFWKRIFKKRPH